jgi:hypothetical protein
MSMKEIEDDDGKWVVEKDDLYDPARMKWCRRFLEVGHRRFIEDGYWLEMSTVRLELTIDECILFYYTIILRG